MIIREASKNDVEKIKEVSYGFQSTKYYSIEKEGLSYRMEIKDFEKNYKKSYLKPLMDEGRKNTTLFVIEENKEILGYIEMLYETSKELVRIVNLWTNEALREKKIGKRLVKASKGWARFNKARGIMVEVENCNYPALRFFMKEGFQICGINEASYCNHGIEENEIGIYLLFNFEAFC